MVRTTVVGVALVMCALLVPRAASAQQATASGIAGVVKDTSGAVLPGVTVEAASPALIEKVRSVVTDGEGRYNIVDLRPGTYTVTFTLAGFSTFRRDGIELPSGFTATVNAEMQVGALDGDGHGDRRVAAGRHAQRPQADRRVERSAQRAAEQREEPEQPRGAHARVPRQRRIRRHRRVHAGRSAARFHGKGGTNVQFDGMGIQHASGNQGYNAERGDRAGTGDVHQRHHGRQQRRRRRS